MEKFFFIFLFSFFSSDLLSQNAEASLWFIGNQPFSQTSTRSVATLDFSDSQLQVEKREDIEKISFLSNSSSICSKKGELLFYSDGCYIFNREHQLMAYGNNINDGRIWREYCVNANSYPSGIASTMILPDPSDTNQYYFIHQTIQQFFPDEYSLVHYTKIDMNERNGLGAVTEKNQLIMLDSVYLGEMSAVKHANGKDWWIIVPEDSTNAYNVLILDSLGVRKSHDQVMGPKVGYWGTGSGQCKFSPDGAKFARWTITEQLFLADFDRESGYFSNLIQIQVQSQDSVDRGGVSFSPNSKFLYVSAGHFVSQFEIEESDIESSKIIVGIYDGFEDVLPTDFRRMQLTPDCRIFINSPGGHRYWHIIQNPNEKGFACNLEQHSLLLPTRTFNTMPYFPNYNLGPIGNEGYPCDSTKITVSSTEVPIFESTAFVYPNPTQGQLYIDLPMQVGAVDFQLFSAAGQQVFAQSSHLTNEAIELGHLPKGIYFYKILNEQGRVWSGKVVIHS